MNLTCTTNVSVPIQGSRAWAWGFGIIAQGL